MRALSRYATQYSMWPLRLLLQMWDFSGADGVPLSTYFTEGGRRLSSKRVVLLGEGKRGERNPREKGTTKVGKKLVLLS